MTDAPPGLFASLRGFAATAIVLLRTRVGLLKVEALEEVGRVRGMLLWGIAAVLLGVAGAVFLALFLTVLFWDSHRLLALGIFAALFIAAATMAVALALRLARQGSQLFVASLAELRQDEAALLAAQTQDGPP
ncbi:MAG: phage holin family protein [Rhodocyclaceae bacterium]|nr:phage holin family protein [Rhodocyclaceae bacterium]